VKGLEFEQRVRRLGALTGAHVCFVCHGRGNLGRLYYGGRFTTLQDRKQDIGKGLLWAMCRQLGISLEDLLRVGQ